jgi:hypothetical protein
VHGALGRRTEHGASNEENQERTKKRVRRSMRRSAGALARDKETISDLTGGLTAGKLAREENR